MLVVEITELGGPEVLRTREVAVPEPGPGELRVAVELVEVLFLDTQLRAGWGRDFFPMRPPWVPGTGVAGTVEGRRVIARTGDLGAYAEQVVVPAEEVYAVPDAVDLATATAALHDGVLALDRLEEVTIGPGDSVLVTAAAGSLGHWFVPLAAAAGADVVAVAGGPDKVTAVADLGADVVLDHREEGWADRLGGPFDVVFDGSGGQVGRAALAATADGGTFFGHGAASGDFGAPGPERRVTTIGVERRLDDETWRRLTLDALSVLERGLVRPRIGQVVPLERAADAHQAIADRVVIGKSLLSVSRHA